MSGFYYGNGNNSITGSMGLTKLGPNTLVLTGSNTYSGGTIITGGAVQIGDGTSGHDGWITGPITDNSWLVYNVAGSQICSSAIGGSGCLQKAGSGTLTLTNSNTFSSSTWISGGTLVLANANALQYSNYCGISPGYTGTLVFSSSVSSHAFTFGSILNQSGSVNNICLQDNANNPVAKHQWQLQHRLFRHPERFRQPDQDWQWHRADTYRQQHLYGRHDDQRRHVATWQRHKWQ